MRWLCWTRAARCLTAHSKRCDATGRKVGVPRMLAQNDRQMMEGEVRR